VPIPVALIAGHAVRARRMRPGGNGLTVLTEHRLELALLLHPPERNDRVPVRADARVVVLPHAPLAARERSPGLTAQPRGTARRVHPRANARVPRRLIDLVHRL